MEHRCSVRKPMELQLMLYKHGLPVQSAVSRNLGLGGMLIDTGTTTWRNNEFLEVEFIGDDGSPGMREQRRRLRVWLFNRDRNGKPAGSLAVA